MNIFHDSQNIKYRSPFGAAGTGDQVQLRIYAEAAVCVQLRLWIDDAGEKLIQMDRENENEFSVKITLPSSPCIVWYFFVVTFENCTVCYGNNRKCLGGAGDIYINEEPHSFQITVYKKFETPQWFKQSIVYQIFPDRFCKAETAGRDEQRLIENWDTLPYYIKNDDGSIRQWNFWGGNLKGIESKLAYLKELHISCIYLNPIFKAESNHRYDTADYMAIDPLLGNEDDFVSLCKAAEAYGIKIILDGVFSHTGIHSIYYKEHPEWYSGSFWWGVKDLPEVDETNPEYLEFVCGENGVLRHWIRLGASGWRFDVADELPDVFIEAARRAIKEENPDAVMIGEVWEDASNKVSYGQRRKFLLGEQFDSVMNYPLRSSIIRFLNDEIQAEDFAAEINSLRENYPKEAFFALFNLLGSHDRKRILTVFNGNKEKLRIAALICCALPGPAVIYYGDEAGLEGENDPDNRRTFPWGREDNELTEYYKTLGRLFDAHKSLKTGDFSIETNGNDEILISRKSISKKAEIFINKKSLKYDIIFKSI